MMSQSIFPRVFVALLILSMMILPARMQVLADGGFLRMPIATNDQATSFFIDTNNVLWGWGSNSMGQVGDGTTINRSEPVRIMENIASVSAGIWHTVAIDTNGSLWIWGQGIAARANEYMHQNVLEPVYVMDAVISAHAIGGMTFVIRSDNSLWGWGSSNFDLLLTDRASNTITAHNPVHIMDGIIDVTFTGGLSSTVLVVTTDGDLLGWGANNNGTIGDGTRDPRPEPVLILRRISAVSSSWGHVLALTIDGNVYAWGHRNNNVFGDGTHDARLTPSLMPTMYNIIAISAGSDTSLMLRSDGILYSVGTHGASLGRRQSAALADRSFPARIAIDNVVAVSMVSAYALAVTANGELWGWGQPLGFRNHEPVRPGTYYTHVLFEPFRHRASGILTPGAGRWSPRYGAHVPIDHLFPQIDTTAPTTPAPGTTTPVVQQPSGIAFSSLQDVLDGTATGPVAANPVHVNMRINDRAMTVPAFNIGGNNYFRIRDIANMMMSTSAEFDVGWDGRAILLYMGERIMSDDGVFDPGLTVAPALRGTAIIRHYPVAISDVAGSYLLAYAEEPLVAEVELPSGISGMPGTGREVTPLHFNINGYNFFMLREMGEILGFNVDWDASTNTILINTR